MKLVYGKFKPLTLGGSYSYKELLKLFNHLLTQAGGDVNQVISWLNQLNQRHPLFEETGGLDTFLDQLEREGVINREKPGDIRLTPGGRRGIRKSSLERVFGGLKKKGEGLHTTPFEGTGLESLSETRPYEFGENPEYIDYNQTFKNAFRRGLNFSLQEKDLEVYEKEHLTNTATVIMIDISHSMVLYGEDRITPAKTVAMALSELIMTQYPKDCLDVVLFYDDARKISVTEIPEVQVGPYHTNTCEGLRLSREILRKKKNINKQIFMITDGKPTVIYHRGQVYKNSWGHDPLIINRTLDEARQCKRQNIVITTFMIARDAYLIDFVETLSRVNGGRAYYADLDNLGKFVLSDYIRNRKGSIRG